MAALHKKVKTRSQRPSVLNCVGQKGSAAVKDLTGFYLSVFTISLPFNSYKFYKTINI